MNKVSIIKITRIILSAIIVLLWSTHVGAQENPDVAPASSDTFFSLYRDYTSAGFAVEWPVSAGGVNAVRSRLGRYSYLAFYTSPQQLQNKPLPLVTLGFFKTRSEAEKFVVDNSSAFAGMRVVNVSPTQHQQLFSGEKQKNCLYLNINFHQKLLLYRFIKRAS